MRNIFQSILIVAFYSLSFLVSAQTVAWRLPLSNEYSSISLFGNDLYKVAKGQKIGIIQSDGTIIVPIVATELTGFYEGKALVLSNANNHKQILGYLTESGQYVSFDKAYYGVDGFFFYSEGLLPVQNEKGKLGYLDEMGKAVLGFRGEFEEIHPFTEGMAAVVIEEEFTLIDRQGNEAIIITGGEIGPMTNLYQGMAYVQDAYDDNVFYGWNKKQGNSKCKKLKSPQMLDLDYLYCFSEITGRPARVPFMELSVNKPDFAPVLENERYGFSHDGTVILPCQFESASNVVNGLSIVSLNGQLGILQILEHADGFSASAPSDPFKYIAGKSVDCHFFLNIPTEWRSKELRVSATDLSTGEHLNVSSNGENKYSFTAIPSEPQKKYLISVASGSMELWNGEATMPFKKKQLDLQTSLEVAGLKSNTARADADDKVIVRAIVTNPGSEVVRAVVSMRGSDAFKAKTETHLIPAHGSVVVESYFVVKENLENQYVKVTTDNGTGSTQYSLRLKTVDDIDD